MIILKCTSASGLYNPMVNSSFVAMARPKYREESSEMDRIGTEVTILDLEVLRRTEKNEDLHDSHFRSKFDVRLLRLNILNYYQFNECFTWLSRSHSIFPVL